MKHQIIMARKSSSIKKRSEYSFDKSDSGSSLNNAVSAIKTKIAKKEAERKTAAKQIVDKTCKSVAKLFDNTTDKDSDSLKTIEKKIIKIRNEQNDLLKKLKEEMKRRREEDRKMISEWIKKKEKIESALEEFEKHINNTRERDKKSFSIAKKGILKETSNFKNKIGEMYSSKNSLGSLKRSLSLFKK
eukprot:GHVP01029848.1.p1 GENE.GHVP01029848.1~~GHVP01029848.1.p1  ORF type:complete len:188 (+),score=48.99 GHVP01029848.1:1132-1695(+)